MKRNDFSPQSILENIVFSNITAGDLPNWTEESRRVRWSKTLNQRSYRLDSSTSILFASSSNRFWDKTFDL